MFFFHLSSPMPQKSKKRPLALLPSSDDDKTMRQLFGTLVSHILATHMSFFNLHLKMFYIGMFVISTMHRSQKW